MATRPSAHGGWRAMPPFRPRPRTNDLHHVRALGGKTPLRTCVDHVGSTGRCTNLPNQTRSLLLLDGAPRRRHSARRTGRDGVPACGAPDLIGSQSYGLCPYASPRMDNPADEPGWRRKDLSPPARRSPHSLRLRCRNPEHCVRGRRSRTVCSIQLVRVVIRG